MTQLNTKRFQYDILLVSPFNWGPLLSKWPVYHSTQSSRSHLTPTILFSRESIKAESEVTQSKEAHWAKLFNRFGTFLNTLPKKIDSIFAKPSCIILPAVTHSFKRATDSVHNFWSSNKCSREQRTQVFKKKFLITMNRRLSDSLKFWTGGWNTNKISQGTSLRGRPPNWPKLTLSVVCQSRLFFSLLLSSVTITTQQLFSI